MKKAKIIIFAIVVLATALIYSSFGFAREAVNLKLVYDGISHDYSNYKITLKVDNVEVTNLTMPPVIIDDRTYVPVKEIFTKLGAVVDWKSNTKEIYIGYGDRMIIMQIGSGVINNNGNIVLIPVAPRIVNDKTMIPVKYAAEAFGFGVHWDDATKTVYINTMGINYPINGSSNAPADNTSSGSDSNYGDTGDSSSAYQPAAVELSVDISPNNIIAMNYPETRITSIENRDNKSFVIKADSEISSVEKLLLEDNRFVLDIYNAETALPDKNLIINGSPYIAQIRSAQNRITPQKVTRIVFDLLEPTGFNVSISPDRKSLIFSFENNTITDVRLSKTGNSDILAIEGTSTPVVSVTPLTNPDRLAIDIPLSSLGTAKQPNLSGTYVISARMSQYTSSAVRIVLDLSTAVSYTVSNENSTTIIKISKPNYKNLSYNTATKTLTVSKGSNALFSASSVHHTDMYYMYKYVLSVPLDLSEYVGYGEYIIKDDYVSSVEINTLNGVTYFTVNENRILAVNVTEDQSNIYIKFLLPKEKYSKILVLDAGHGYNDPGAHGNGLVEKNLTLDIVLKTIALLEADGSVKVYATRVDDTYPDLNSRAAMADEVGDIFVSVHINSFTNPEKKGTEVYYYKHDNDDALGFKSSQMAAIFQKNLLNFLGTDDRRIKSEEFLVLKRTHIPAVLCEVEFISNPEAAAKLGTESFRMAAAQSIYTSIIETFSIYHPAR